MASGNGLEEVGFNVVSSSFDGRGRGYVRIRMLHSSRSRVSTNEFLTIMNVLKRSGLHHEEPVVEHRGFTYRFPFKLS
jgi:hypothetical protein